jgi:YidC/Oxa1 family membrane protein insertase
MFGQILKRKRSLTAQSSWKGRKRLSGLCHLSLPRKQEVRMASSLSCTTPSLIPLSLPFIDRTKTSTSLPPIHPLHRPKPLIPRGSLCVARFGFRPGLFPDPDNAEAVIKNLFGRAESIIYTIADAAVSNPEQVVDSSNKQNSDWLSGITSCLESTLKVWSCPFLFF